MNVHENLKLKGLNFDLEIKVNDFTLIVDQSQKRINALGERSTRVLRDLEAACLNQDKEQKRLTAELDVAKR